jgi:hypothetical protein
MVDPVPAPGALYKKLAAATRRAFVERRPAIVMGERPYEYRFKRIGASTPGAHCTYCPTPQNESCSLPCTKEYERLEAERGADGVKVTDHDDG